MMQDAVKSRELISALVDGQLRGDEFAHTVQRLGEAQEARLTWHAYQVVGDVLRAGDALASDRDTAFMQRLKLSLQQEAPLAARTVTPELIADYAEPISATGLKGLQDVAANEGVFRWKLLAGLASLAAVSVLGWQVSSGWNEPNGRAELAQVSLPGAQHEATQALARAGTEPQVMIRDPQLDALLAAHRQFAGTSALQMPAGFLRNATFEGAGR